MTKNNIKKPCLKSNKLEVNQNEKQYKIKIKSDIRNHDTNKVEEINEVVNLSNKNNEKLYFNLNSFREKSI